MLERQPALQIDAVRLTHRPVRAQFDRRPLHECPRRHDDLIGIARHIPRLRRGKRIHRRHCLNRTRKCFHTICISEHDRLNDVAAHIRKARERMTPDPLEDPGSKHRSLECLRHHMRRKE